MIGLTQPCRTQAEGHSMIIIPDFLPAVIVPFWSRLLAALSAQIYRAGAAARSHYLGPACHPAWTGRRWNGPVPPISTPPGPGTTPRIPCRGWCAPCSSSTCAICRCASWKTRSSTNLASQVVCGLQPRSRRGRITARWNASSSGSSPTRPAPSLTQVLRQIDQDLPTERQQPQIGDTYALRANAAQETLITRCATPAAASWTPWPRLTPPVTRRVLADLDQAALFGAADEVKEYRLTAEQRRSRLATTAVAAAHAGRPGAHVPRRQCVGRRPAPTGRHLAGPPRQNPRRRVRADP